LKVVRITVFILLLALPATSAEMPSPAGAETRAVNTDVRFLLNVFAALGDGQIEGVLRSLKLLSVTEEVRSGDWEKMKPLLDEFSRSGLSPGAIWFAGSDGSYYTEREALTDQDARPRRYFAELMKDGQVAGDLVINISTGKRNAALAVPVSRNGDLVGALGTLISLEEMSRVLDEKMGLPEDMIFYALDAKGRTALHRSSALFFRYPSDAGSKALQDKVAEMLAKPQGAVSYDFHGQRAVVFRKSPLTGWVFALGFPTDKPDEPGEQLPPILSEMEKEISGQLDKIDRSVAGVAMRLSETGLDSPEAGKLLADLCVGHGSIVYSATTDPSGTIMIMEPEAYVKYENSELSAQEQVFRLRESGKPVLGHLNRFSEGFNAVDLGYPVYSPDGHYAGSVTVIISPEVLLSDIISPVFQNMPVYVRVMQKDGRILYAYDPDEAGRVLFDDPMYKPFPHLITLGKMISREKTGSGRYEFIEGGFKKPVKNLANWATVSLHGTEWRVMVSQARDDGAAAGEDSSAIGIPNHDESLKKLADDPELKKSLSENDYARVEDIFRNFHDDNYGLDSIQWVDARGRNRCGYPEEKSIMDFDFTSLLIPQAKQILLAVWEEEEASFNAPLADGNEGSFFMVPVYNEGEYLGMIYTVQIKQ
jgi:hypothetical protein